MLSRSLVVAAAVWGSAAQPANPWVVVSSPTGSFSITLPGWAGFSLDSAADIGLQVGGKWLSAGAGLTPSDFTSFPGSDVWGDYNATAVTWLDASSKPALVTTISVYQNTPAVVFGE